MYVESNPLPRLTTFFLFPFVSRGDRFFFLENLLRANRNLQDFNFFDDFPSRRRCPPAKRRLQKPPSPFLPWLSCSPSPHAPPSLFLPCGARLIHALLLIRTGVFFPWRPCSVPFFLATILFFSREKSEQVCPPSRECPFSPPPASTLFGALHALEVS